MRKVTVYIHEADYLRLKGNTSISKALRTALRRYLKDLDRNLKRDKLKHYQRQKIWAKKNNERRNAYVWARNHGYFN